MSWPELGPPRVRRPVTIRENLCGWAYPPDDPDEPWVFHVSDVGWAYVLGRLHGSLHRTEHELLDAVAKAMYPPPQDQ